MNTLRSMATCNLSASNCQTLSWYSQYKDDTGCPGRYVTSFMWVAGDTGTKLIDNHMIGYFRFLFLFVRNRNKISGNIKESSIERIYPNYDLFLWYLNEQSQGTSWWSVLVGTRKWQVSMRNYILVFGYNMVLEDSSKFSFMLAFEGF